VREPKRQQPYLTIELRSARLTARLRPLATDQRPVPTQKRLGRHEKPTPTPVREQASERAEEGAIRRPQRRPGRLPAKHRELMPQHDQLDVLGKFRSPASYEQLQQTCEG
jgi:hypothetical protein